MSTVEKPKSNFDNFLQKGEIALKGFFVIWFVVSISMIIMGGVFWADGEWQLAVNCDLNKKINQSLGIYTPAEIEVFYQACRANANAELRWAQPVAAIGAGLFILWCIPLQAYGLSTAFNPPKRTYPSRKSQKREIV